MEILNTLIVKDKEGGPAVKIKRLDIEGFRSLKNIAWNPGDLNIIIGPNGTGKSNLLRFLEMISCSSGGKLSNHIQKAGGMDPLLWDGTANNISLRMITTPLQAQRNVERESLQYELNISRLGRSSTYRIDHELLAKYDIQQVEQHQMPFKFLERQGTRNRIFDAEQRTLVAPDDAIAEEETLLSVAGGPFSPNPYIVAFQRELTDWVIYHDVHVNQDAPIRQAIVTKTDKRVQPDGQNLVNVLHTLYAGDREFKKNVHYAMRAAFGEDFEELVFPPAADERIQLRIRWKSLQREQSVSELSDGTMRFLLLLAILASPASAPLIAIDEPEVGLHPAMFAIIADYAEEASERSQIIFTTHSPSFLDAFAGVEPTTTVMNWENGETQLHNMDREKLSYWLKHYSMGHLFTTGELVDLL